IPQYSNYISRSKAASTLAELGSVQTAIAVCAQETGALAGCTGGSNGINNPTTTANVLNTTVTDGKISGDSGAAVVSGTTPTAFTLTPAPLTDTQTAIQWTLTGLC
ncbi:MAG: pilin, partial [Pseudomonadota bacterium]